MSCSAKALTLRELAAELGRSESWLYSNWERLVRHKHLPAPLLDHGPPSWSAAQVYAVLDAKLTPAQRAAAFAFRAALDAAVSAPSSRIARDHDAEARAVLDARFAKVVS